MSTQPALDGALASSSALPNDAAALAAMQPANAAPTNPDMEALKAAIMQAADAGTHTQPIEAKKVEALLGPALRQLASDLAGVKNVDINVHIGEQHARGA